MNTLSRLKLMIQFIFGIILFFTILCSCEKKNNSFQEDGEHLVPIRAWQIHDEINDEQDLAYARKVIDAAPSFGINTIVFAQVKAVNHLYKGVDNSQFDGMEYGRTLHDLAVKAASNGIKTWLWIHELEDIPKQYIKDGATQLDDPKIYEFLMNRYRKVFTDFPSFNGVMLTFHETRYKLFDDSEAVSDMSPPERFAKITNTINQVCKEFGKDLIVRTFVYTMEELEWAREGFSMTDTAVIIQSKTVPQDWEPFFPHNPAIGAFPNHRQIVEFDCSNEYTGKNFIPYTSPEYFAYRWRYDLKQPGVKGFNIRLNHHGYDALFTPNAINIYTIYRLTMDSTVSTDQIWQEWTTKQYGSDAALHIEAALKPTFDIVNKAFFPLGFWFSKHSGLPEYNYAGNHITGHTSATHWWPEIEPGYNKARWWPDDVSKAAWAKRQNSLMKPNPDDFERLLGEKDTAVILANECMFHLKQAQPYLTQTQYDELYELLYRLQLVTVVRRMHAEAYFGLREMEAGHDVPGLKERINRSIKGLFMMEKVTNLNKPEVEDTTEYHQPPGVPWKIRSVAKELNVRLNQIE